MTVNLADPRIRIVAGVVITHAVSAFGGYLIANRILKEKYNIIAAREIREAKEFYTSLMKDQTPEEMAEKYEEVPRLNDQDIVELAAELVEQDRLTADYQADEIPVVLQQNIFVNNVPLEETFDYDEEVRTRSRNLPYVISLEEFMENEPEFNQEQFTYYEGDDVLANRQDEPVIDTDSLVGNLNLLKFGHGSKDPSMVYIRNEHLGMDFEISKSKGTYEREVVGYIEHSDHRPLRRMRSTDE